MSTRSTYPGQDTVGQPMSARSVDGVNGVDGYHEAEGGGWVAFAGIMISIVGIMNLIYGIAAVDSANFFIRDAQYVFSDLNTWGWIMMGLGVLQLAAAFSIFARTSWGRWVGIATATGNCILQLLFLPSYPLLSLTLFAAGVLVIYGLVAYGGRQTAF